MYIYSREMSGHTFDRPHEGYTGFLLRLGRTSSVRGYAVRRDGQDLRDQGRLRAQGKKRVNRGLKTVKDCVLDISLHELRTYPVFNEVA